MSSKELIDPGVLALYAMGIASQREQENVEKVAAAHPEIKQEINSISEVLEKYALANATEPSPLIKPMLMASIDYSERIKNGEVVSYPPLLHKNSTAQDYAFWINRPDMNFPSSENKDLFAKIIGHTPEMTTAIIWLTKGASPETHHNEYEHFLILEGTCDITVSGKVTHLVANDYFQIPLHSSHFLTVTSPIACKAILQRIAA